MNKKRLSILSMLLVVGLYASPSTYAVQYIDFEPPGDGPSLPPPDDDNNREALVPGTPVPVYPNDQEFDNAQRTETDTGDPSLNDDPSLDDDPMPNDTSAE